MTTQSPPLHANQKKETRFKTLHRSVDVRAENEDFEPPLAAYRCPGGHLRLKRNVICQE